MTSSLAAPPKRHSRRAAVASGVGTLIEWYDFFIFGTAAALVFPALFFPAFDPLTGTLLSFATFAGGFVARPIGAVLFGHLGDRAGRRTVLMITLVIMGVATVLIGLLPTYDSVGVLAPVLLVTLRLVQGLAVSGEFGGALLLAIEHAPDGKRGLYGSAPQVSLPIALALSSTVFLAISTVMSDEQFMSWGWRVPFVASIIAVIVGLWIRISLPETAEFAEVKAKQQVARFPMAEVFKDHKRDFWLVVFAYPATGLVYYILTTFSVTYGVSSGFSRNQMLWMTVISALIILILMPLAAGYSDKIGRKPVYVAGLIIMGAGTIPLFPLIATGKFIPAFVGIVVPLCGFGISWGVLTTFFSDVFSARVRYSAVGTAYTFGTILGASTGPLIATFIFSRTGSVLGVTLYMLGWISVSIVAALLMWETMKRNVLNNKEGM